MNGSEERHTRLEDYLDNEYEERPTLLSQFEK